MGGALFLQVRGTGGDLGGQGRLETRPCSTDPWEPRKVVAWVFLAAERQMGAGVGKELGRLELLVVTAGGDREKSRDLNGPPKEQ